MIFTPIHIRLVQHIVADHTRLIQSLASFAFLVKLLKVFRYFLDDLRLLFLIAFQVQFFKISLDLSNDLIMLLFLDAWKIVDNLVYFFAQRIAKCFFPLFVVGISYKLLVSLPDFNLFLDNLKPHWRFLKLFFILIRKF